MLRWSSLRQENFDERNARMNKKGVVLFISLIVIAVLLVLTGTYFSSLLTEKRSSDFEGFVLQALGLSEAGANHAQSELRKRIRTDLKDRAAGENQASVFQNYITSKDSLGFLRDYAYPAGGTQFTVAGNEARLSVAAANLDTAVQGSYAATIVVKANGDPTNPSGEVFVFPYTYTIESQGTVTRTIPNINRNTRLLQGSFSVTVRRDTFAKYALFTSHHRTPSGTTVWFTANTNFTGPVNTNDRFSFANNPSAHFTEEVTQHESKARFYNDGNPKLMNADSNPPRDVPTFDKGFSRGQDIINLESSITQTDLKSEALGGAAEPGSNGIYVPNNGVSVIGGIYIRGNQGQHADDAVVSMASAANGPIYTITQGATTKIITIDYTNSQTKIQTVGGSLETYQGIPDGTKNEGILIYANDDIKSFSGTVEKNSKVTVSSERDIVITNNVVYEQYTPSPLSAEGFDNALGILSWGGNVRIGTTAPNDINIHGVVMAPHGIFTVDDYDSHAPRGTATILGGSITDFYGPFGTFSGDTPTHGYGRNFVYDSRMLHGIAPPYFPYLSNFISFDDGKLDNKLVWQDQGA
jgi:hypothetical protein